MALHELMLHHLVPGLGVIIALCMFSSPIPGVLQVQSSESLADFNPLPALLGLFNCAGWVGYSLTNGDLYVFAANGPGFLVGAFLVLTTLPFAAKQQRTLLVALFLGFSTLLLGVSIAGVKLLQRGAMDVPGLQTTWGLTANFILVNYYAAPLSTLWAVLRTRDSASIYTPLTLCAMLNSTLWVLYGFAVGDLFISVPNSVGFVFACIQLALKLAFPAAGDSGGAGGRAAGDAEDGSGGDPKERKRLLDGRTLAPQAAASD